MAWAATVVSNSIVPPQRWVTTPWLGRVIVGCVRMVKSSAWAAEMTPYSATILIEAAAAVIAVARMLSLRLAGIFPVLLSFLSAIAVTGITASFFSLRSHTYFWIYTVQTPVYCILAILAAREVFAVVFKKYPGIRSAGRMAIFWCIGFASMISLAVAVGRPGRPETFTHPLLYIELVRRSTVLTVALFILFILYTLSRYPLELGWNIWVSSVLFSILFLGEATQLLIDSFSPRLYSGLVDLAADIFGAACTLVWAALLRPEPNTGPVVVKYSSEQEQHLLDQLDSLNQLLTRAARQ